MNTMKMTLIAMAVLALAGCIIAPAPGPAYYGEGSRYEAAPLYGGSLYIGGYDEHRDGDHEDGHRTRNGNHWR